MTLLGRGAESSLPLGICFLGSWVLANRAIGSLKDGHLLSCWVAKKVSYSRSQAYLAPKP